MQGSVAPSAWRVLSAAQPCMSRFSSLALAGELPTMTGFAEQFRDMNPHTMAGLEDSLASSDASEETDLTAMAETGSDNMIQSCGGSPKTCWLGNSR
jgi:hypothetical protein